MASDSSNPASQAAIVASILSQVASEGDKFLNGDSEEARQKLVDCARELSTAASSPIENLLWNIWALPTRTAALRVAMDLKLFETAVQDNGRPKTDEDFAAAVGASPTLVKRIAHACVSMDMLDEQGPGLYVPNDVTRLLSKPEYVGGIIHCFDITQLSFSQMPKYLRNTKFQNPENALDGPFQYANKCGSAFAWFSDRPDNFQAFHKYVHALRIHRPSWIDMYPVREYLVDGLKGAPDGDASALVGLGGGTGQILQDFQAAVPEYAGRLVLQEIPDVINVAQSLGVGKESGNGSRIKLQEHDFFTPQPLKGARAYFMRSVLHDWPDEQCRTILRHVKDAMEPGYSKILINDCVCLLSPALFSGRLLMWMWLIVEDEGAAWQHVALDMFMMAQLAARERTEREWYALIESCGLKIVGIYNKGQGNEGLIEVVCK